MPDNPGGNALLGALDRFWNRYIDWMTRDARAFANGNGYWTLPNGQNHPAARRSRVADLGFCVEMSGPAPIKGARTVGVARCLSPISPA